MSLVGVVEDEVFSLNVSSLLYTIAEALDVRII